MGHYFWVIAMQMLNLIEAEIWTFYEISFLGYEFRASLRWLRDLDILL